MGTRKVARYLIFPILAAAARATGAGPSPQGSEGLPQSGQRVENGACSLGYWECRGTVVAAITRLCLQESLRTGIARLRSAVPELVRLAPITLVAAGPVPAVVCSDVQEERELGQCLTAFSRLRVHNELFELRTMAAGKPDAGLAFLGFLEETRIVATAARELASALDRLEGCPRALVLLWDGAQASSRDFWLAHLTYRQRIPPLLMGHNELEETFGAVAAALELANPLHGFAALGECWSSFGTSVVSVLSGPVPGDDEPISRKKELTEDDLPVYLAGASGGVAVPPTRPLAPVLDAIARSQRAREGHFPRNRQNPLPRGSEKHQTPTCGAPLAAAAPRGDWLLKAEPSRAGAPASGPKELKVFVPLEQLNTSGGAARTFIFRAVILRKGRHGLSLERRRQECLVVDGRDKTFCEMMLSFPSDTDHITVLVESLQGGFIGLAAAALGPARGADP